MSNWERLGGLNVREFDWVAHLRDDEDVAAYIADAYECGDPEFINICLAEVTRAYGKSELRRPTSDGGETLHDALAALAAPSTAQILHLLRDFGLQMRPTAPARTPTG